jgi:hypothetical protein
MNFSEWVEKCRRHVQSDCTDARVQMIMALDTWQRNKHKPQLCLVPDLSNEKLCLDQWILECAKRAFPGAHDHDLLKEETKKCLELKRKTDASVPGLVDGVWHQMILDWTLYQRYYPNLRHDPFTQKTEDRVLNLFMSYLRVHGMPRESSKYIWEVEGLDLSERTIYWNNKEKYIAPACLPLANIGLLLGYQAHIPLRSKRSKWITLKHTVGDLCTESIHLYEAPAQVFFVGLEGKIFTVTGFLSTLTVDDVIRKMGDPDIPKDALRFIYAGKQLSSFFLRDWDYLGHESTVHVVGRIRGC